MNLLHALGFSVILYLILTLFFYFFLLEKAKMMKFILKANNTRKRNDTIEKIKNANNDVGMVLLWPLILFREVLRGIKNKK